MNSNQQIILFASPEPEALSERISEITLPSPHHHVVHFDDIDERLEQHKPSHVFLEMNSGVDTDLLDAIHLSHPQSKIVIMHNGQFHNHLGIFGQRPWLQNFISCMPSFLPSDLENVIHKLCGDHHFGLERYFPEGVVFHQVKVRDSKAKESYIDALLEPLSPHLSSSAKARLGNILDEMMMNVLWDAPRDKEGKPLYNHVSRHTRIQLTPEQEGTVTVAHHEKTLGISCSDPFGAITLPKIIQYLNKCFYSDEQIGSEGAGAGLGLYMIYNLSENFTINVIPGEKTEFILLFKTRNALKKKERQKSFHYYEVPHE